ncbi:MAG: YiiX/YebB-like N1pC/P60 family cysteine hydrolase [Syntrophomonadaceae bacterium]|nr:YiiX/YebB-like N1pC/P60 family cysteine hydrolase [Syntrophomonadaceae bacterium]
MKYKFATFLKNYGAIIIFPLLSLLLITMIAAANPQVFNNQDAVMFTYFDHALKGHGGYVTSTGFGNRISFAGLEPGDILLGGYDECGYGRFSHAGIYIGNNQVIEGYADLGITKQSIDHYWNYSEICLLQVDAPNEIKIKAVEYAKKHQGKLFYPICFKSGEKYWNCTKIMWKAYADQGFELVEDNDFWISPDAFYKNSKLRIIREEGR